MVLEKPFEVKEVQDTLFQMARTKAPGVDGFTTWFFQQHWQLLQDEVTQAVIGFLNGSDLLLGLNDISIMLIPKL